MNEEVSAFGVVHKALVNPIKAYKQTLATNRLNVKNDAYIKGLKTDKNALARTELKNWDKHNYMSGPGKPGDTFASRRAKYLEGKYPKGNAPSHEELMKPQLPSARYDIVTRQRVKDPWEK